MKKGEKLKSELVKEIEILTETVENLRGQKNHLIHTDEVTRNQIASFVGAPNWSAILGSNSNRIPSWLEIVYQIGQMKGQLDLNEAIIQQKRVIARQEERMRDLQDIIKVRVQP